MHQREQEKCDRRTASKLRDIAGEISSSRNFVEVAFMAAHRLERHERDPLVELLSLISERLKNEADSLESISAEIAAQADASRQEDTTDAA